MFDPRLGQPGRGQGQELDNKPNVENISLDVVWQQQRQCSSRLSGAEKKESNNVVTGDDFYFSTPAVTLEARLAVSSHYVVVAISLHGCYPIRLTKRL